MEKFCIVSIVLLSVVISSVHGLEDGYRCGHDESEHYAANEAAACPTYGSCDNPSFRAKYEHTRMNINVAYYVVCMDNGTKPTYVDELSIKKSHDYLQTLYDGLGITFTLVDVIYINDSNLFLLDTTREDFVEEFRLKRTPYSEHSTQRLNLFITMGRGNVIGYATFPWDPIALTPAGGIWLNSVIFRNSIDMTIAHEVGHCIGLWHTFQDNYGASSCPFRNNCYEYVHELNDPAANAFGDFCADTMAAPLTYTCKAFTGGDCNGTKYKSSESDFKNVMSYTSCSNLFTQQQAARAKCWSCSTLGSVVSCT